MNRTAKAQEDVNFSAEVSRQFGPFALRCDMTGPVEDDLVLSTLEWTVGPLGYRWGHDPSDGSVSVTVSLAVAGGVLWGSLAELVVAHRLGVPQDVRQSGPLARQVESHTAWLQRLHATLTGPDTQAFMECGGARFSNSD